MVMGTLQANPTKKHYKLLGPRRLHKLSFHFHPQHPEGRFAPQVIMS